MVSGDDAPHHLLVSATYRLPAINDGKGVLGLLLGGWQMNGIAVFQSGLPVGADRRFGPGRRPGHSTIPRASAGSTPARRPSPGRGRTARAPSEPVVWKVLPPYTLRTLPTRLDTVRTDRPVQLDFSLFKSFNLPAGMKLQVRAEAFNAFNTPWFGAPNTTVNATAFGTVTPTQANDPRNIQLGFRLSF